MRKKETDNESGTMGRTRNAWSETQRREGERRLFGDGDGRIYCPGSAPAEEAAEKKRAPGRPGGERAVFLSMLLLLAVLLAGCGGTGPEKRDYPLVLAWDHDGEAYEVIYGIADLSRITAQEKGSGGESGTAGLSFKGKDMEELRAAYDRSQQYYLDLGHVQAIIFSERLMQDTEKLAYLLKALEDDPVLGKNAYVFAAEEPGRLMQISAGEPDTLGEYLTGLYENKGGMGREAVLLEDLCYDWNNYRTITALPRLRAEEEQVILEEPAGDGN